MQFETRFGKGAQEAVGVEGARIAKSLSFKVDDQPIIIVVAGDAKVDNSRYKAQFHTKAKMLTHEEAHTLIGHDVGGVCPFALPENVKVYLDVSLKRFETVFPAAGSDNSASCQNCSPHKASTCIDNIILKHDAQLNKWSVGRHAFKRELTTGLEKNVEFAVVDKFDNQFAKEGVLPSEPWAGVVVGVVLVDAANE